MLITVVHVDWSDHPNKCPGSDGARLDFREGVKVHPVLSGVLWNRKRHPEAIWRLPGDHQGYWLRSELRGHFSLTVKKSTLCFNMSYLNYLIFMNTLWYKRCQSTEKIKRALLWAPHLSSCKQMRLKVNSEREFCIANDMNIHG